MSDTVTRNKGLMIEEPLLFDMGHIENTAVDVPKPPKVKSRLGKVKRGQPVGLPGLSEPEVVRHYTRLSQKNYGIDTGFYPLGSCTMKHNPRINERIARLDGFADIHPMQPESTVQGALQVVSELAHWLKELTGMPKVAMTPAAGAHGELCGMMSIRAAHQANGNDHRNIVLVPESAHGTNPATAAICGYKIETIADDGHGRVDVAALKERVAGDKGNDVAALMLTNPNTCGLFEHGIMEISKAIHDCGAYFYMDGANFNAIMGRVRISDLGVDCMHINLHKTFSTPHGGGGPGSGPTVFSDRLAAYIPLPWVEEKGGGVFGIVEHKEQAGEHKPFGRMRSFHGQFGVFVRALSYMKSMGIDGLRQASGDAVLNANYILARLKSELSPSFEGPCMHEALFDDRCLKGTGVETLDLAKAMLDEGLHPMTMYFPLVVHGAMLMEPTETESKATLDKYCDTMIALVKRARAGDADYFKNAPQYTPRTRLDETGAARKPVLTCCAFVPEKK